MTKIFKQLARHWAVCLVVFALLFVQAYCDLALPDYTSKIVDTGIQQGGIESPLPQTVRQSTLDALSLLMSEEDAQKLQNAYQYYLQDDGVLQLRSDLTEAVGEALLYLDQALDHGFRPGMGRLIPDRMFWAQPDDDEQEGPAGRSGAPAAAPVAPASPSA